MTRSGEAEKATAAATAAKRGNRWKSFANLVGGH